MICPCWAVVGDGRKQRRATVRGEETRWQEEEARREKVKVNSLQLGKFNIPEKKTEGKNGVREPESKGGRCLIDANDLHIK